jgi:hypothetical protein
MSRDQGQHPAIHHIICTPLSKNWSAADITNRFSFHPLRAELWFSGNFKNSILKMFYMSMLPDYYAVVSFTWEKSEA